MNLKAAVAVIAAVSLVGCATASSATQAPPSSDPRSATAKLESRSGSSVTGSATFTQTSEGVQVEIEIDGASEGPHGLHLHETGDCSAPDATSAGGHWNPTSEQHGDLAASSHHAGDLGNITVDADGKGRVTHTNPSWSIGPAEGKHDVVGKAVVFHASADDLQSQPAGNSGARQACGVVLAQ